MGDRDGSPVAPEGKVTALGRLAGHCYDRRRRVLVLWLVAIVGFTVVAQLVGTHFENKFTSGNTESQQAAEPAQRQVPLSGGRLRRRRLPHVDAHRGQSRRDLRRGGFPATSGARGRGGQPFSPEGAHQISAHANVAYAVVQFDQQTSDLPPGAINAVINTARAAARPGFQVELGGQPISSVQKISPGASEGIGVTAAMIIMLLAFGSVVAMGLPILTALFGLGIGVALLELLTHLLVVPNFSPEMAAMIGIGVGIDYALFIVTRYRQGIFEGRDPRDAVVTSLMTAGRSVLFAGGTVVISLFGLFLIGQPYMIGLATGCIAAVFMVLIAALTLLPAMLGFAGGAIDKLHIPGLLQSGGPPPEHSFWYRWSRLVQRRAWVTGTLALLILLVLAIPVFSMRLAFTDASNDPASADDEAGLRPASAGFRRRLQRPPHRRRRHARSRRRADRGTGSTRPCVRACPTSRSWHRRSSTRPRPERSSPSSRRRHRSRPRPTTLVQTLRSDVIPPVVRGTDVHAQVGGQTAGGIDAANFLGSRLFLVIGAVLILSFLLLMTRLPLASCCRSRR